MSITRRLTGLLAAAAGAVALLAGTTAPAQAYSPNPAFSKYYYDTDSCPCSGGNLTDPFDNTYFAYDAGGLAVKMELVSGGAFVGKVEFHPNDEKLWVYDTRNDGDSFYVTIGYASGGTYHSLGTVSPPGTDEVVDLTVKDYDIPDGASVDISVYDDAGPSDLIGAARGTGAAVA
ncbi:MULTISPECIES: hypothetical protein [Streptomyces]|uniref:Secreted protein n=2 Tax=Streptomyces TaxID=1883 RepID=A0A2U9PAB0_STRAS|nr:MULTISPECIES: hypothetical protein [Streptomyces]AWT46031.1 hypothetical protein DMT42_29560 [Streptomyces actuosus]MBM4822688.1 hypothetical protein [Streptomyces actuosus]GHF47764.1 hypothetical protein GCM10018783_16340 [Streptomyces griseosporeus]